MSAGTMTLEASTTAHEASTGHGHRVKSGDATRTLVGMVYMDAGTPGTFANTATKRFVASYFNRRQRALANRLGTNATTTSTAFVEAATALRNEFIAWDDDVVDATGGGFFTNDTANAVTYVTTWIDGAFVTGTQTSVSGFPTASGALQFSTRMNAVLAEGYHYSTLAFRVGSNTGTLGGSSSNDGNGSYNIGWVWQ